MQRRKSKRYTVQYRRKREGKTNYKKRLKIVMSGKDRLVIRKSSKHIWAQIIKYLPQGDKVLGSAHSRELLKLGWKASCSNVPAAYLTGLLLAQKIKHPEELVVDIGIYTPVKKSRIYACLKGARDGGLKFKAEEEIFPGEDRIRGEHISKFASMKKQESQFSKVSKLIDLTKIQTHFEEIKNKVKALKK
ncbi:50S ribosomal protein L18 [Candidatus Woesearchaeota archaeon]|nr:MAG: 50S ribosomal protein L18 [Candidatus Woesearchaeota archaeon]